MGARGYTQGALAIVAITMLAITAQRVHTVQDETALWSEATQVSPAKPRPWVNLGIQYQRAGAELEAEAAYRRASMLAENPARPDLERRTARAMADTNRASLLVQEGRFPEAWALIGVAHDRSPTFEPVTRMYQWIDAHRP